MPPSLVIRMRSVTVAAPFAVVLNNMRPGIEFVAGSIVAVPFDPLAAGPLAIKTSPTAGVDGGDPVATQPTVDQFVFPVKPHRVGLRAKHFLVQF